MSTEQSGSVGFDQLSEPSDLAPVVLPDDVYVLIDGGDRQRDTATSTAVWRVDADGAHDLATVPVPLRSPVAWSSGDDEVTVVGMNCSTLVDGEGRPTCAEAPLVAAVIDLDGEVETWALGVVTSGEVGFSAGRLGDAGIAVVATDPATADPHALTVAATGEQAVEQGVVDASLVCASPEVTALVPRELAPGTNQVLRIATGGIEPIGVVPPPDAELAAVTGCTDGAVLVRALSGLGVQNLRFSTAAPAKPTTLEVPPRFAAGEVDLGSGGRAFSWTADGETWRLAEERDGAWTAVGQIASQEPPQRTVRGETTYAALVLTDGNPTFEVIG